MDIEKLTKEELRVVLGENIRKAREYRDMTRDEIAEQMGLTISHIGLIERGERGVTTHNLVKLSQIFGTPIETFFYYHEQNPNGEPRNLKRAQNLIMGLNEDELNCIISIITSVCKMNRASIA